MQQLELMIQNAAGLHARPARVFVDLAKQFQSAIHVSNGVKRVNGKSLIALLTLGVTSGQPIALEVSGEDEAAACAALAAAVGTGLGEDPAAHAPEPVSVTVAPTAPATPDGLLRGVPGAPGVAVGPLFRYARAAVAVDQRAADPQTEAAALDAALLAAQEQLLTLGQQIAARADAEAAIFAVHHELLADPDLLRVAHAAIDGGTSAGVAWQRAVDGQIAQLAQLTDLTLAGRTADLRDVRDRVLRLLAADQTAAPTLPATPVIVVADDLTPSETVSLDPQLVLGFCTASGGPNAHTAILARALGLPAVVAAGPAVLAIPAGTTVILDGGAGTLLRDPDAAALAAAEAAQQTERDQRGAALAAASAPATLLDGGWIEVAANIGSAAEAARALAAGADGVGLLRTEFLFLERATAPTEDEQLAVYQAVAHGLAGRPTIVRTLDIGGDKPLPYLQLPKEENPFLGERGIRLCLARPELLRQQLRAILRAAAAGPLRVMFPMVCDLEELRAARAMLEELRAELHAPPIEVGIMIEIPSAALLADCFAAEVDFFSIGTNDLTQYTLAIDRTHPTLAARADGLHPAVLRLIARVCKAAHAADRWVGVCGELAADPLAVPILIGLGVDELSVSVPAIPTVKAQIRTLSLAECQARAQHALRCGTAAQVRAGASHQ